ncbi:GMC family oxidoreductase [Thalassomonas viridans]|uniref:GMC family oxidoreductase n=1 Tax=Thalassomonas viridans TaxID=137584 RepID=A0AAF0CDL8_9GAMM|nr:GMC family oxidoreductase N-terminal domain-containing protein [Thalassomonas viridans]WDE08926.1 GMC family oxidoreductase [Thalassomonas viridans]
MLPIHAQKLPVFDDFIQSAQHAGFKANDDFNGADQEGEGYYQLTQKDGRRFSAAKGFLTPNLDRLNLTVLTDVSVTKLIIDNKR